MFFIFENEKEKEKWKIFVWGMRRKRQIFADLKVELK